MKARHKQNLFLQNHRSVPCSRVAWAALAPFLAAALLGTLFFRAGGGGSVPQQTVVRHPSRVLEETLRPVGCVGAGCTGQAAGLPNPQTGSDGASGSGVVEGSGGGSSSGGGGSGATVQEQAKELPKLFLFIGILSGRGYRHRRLAVREAWSNRAQVPGQVVSKFILSEDERTPQVEKELEAYGDIVFVREKTNYKSILYKTFYVLEYAADNYDAAFVLKTDDDAFINVNPLMDQLRLLCENKDCQHERLYLGKMAKHSEVLLQPGHKWNNAAFHNHTGLKEYPNYMMGGGYVVSGEVARILVDVHSRMRLKFTPIEDATLGFWLMAMDLRHVDHPKFYTWAAPCCFKAPIRKPGERFVTRFQLADEFEADLCTGDPWLVLHKIDSPTKMRYVGSRVANCSASNDPWALPPSIAEHVPADRQAYYAQQREAALKQQQAAGQQGTPAADSSSNAGRVADGTATSSSSAAGVGAGGTATISSSSSSIVGSGAGGASSGGSSTIDGVSSDLLPGATTATSRAAAGSVTVQ